MKTATLLQAAIGDDRPEGAQDPTYDGILAAAVELFTAHGIRRTSIEAIAKRAGISRPTLYTRFRDKDAIVQAIILRDTRRLVERLQQGLLETGTAAERLVRYFVSATTAVGRHPLTRKVVRDDLEYILPFMTHHSDVMIRFGMELLRPALASPAAREAFEGLDRELLLETLCRLALSVITQPGVRLDVFEAARLERLAQSLLIPMLSQAQP